MMIKKYCAGLPLYIAAAGAVLFVHALAQHWDHQRDEPQRPAITHQA